MEEGATCEMCHPSTEELIGTADIMLRDESLAVIGHLVIIMLRHIVM